MSQPLQPLNISLNTVEATFIHRALLTYSDTIKSVMASEAPGQMEEYRGVIQEVGRYQHKIITDIMEYLTENFETDTKYLLPE